MKIYYILIIAIILAFPFMGCKKAILIAKFSGTWTIDKSEVSYYTNGDLDTTIVVENAGTLILKNEHKGVENPCNFSFLPNYVPLGIMNLRIISSVFTDSTCLWYAEPNNTNRITFWAGQINGGSSYPSSTYTRVKKGSKKEEWMYIELNDIQQIAVKEILYVTKTSNN